MNRQTAGAWEGGRAPAALRGMRAPFLLTGFSLSVILGIPTLTSGNLPDQTCPSWTNTVSDGEDDEGGISIPRTPDPLH